MIIAKLIVLLVGLFGNCWLWTSYVNRLFGLPWHDKRLHQLRRVHDVMLFAVPIPLAWSVYSWNANTDIVAGFSSADGLQRIALAFWIFPLLGLLFFATKKLKQQLMRRPIGYEKTFKQIIDVTADLGKQPIGSGEHENMFAVPGNQSCTVEWNHKRLELPRLPPAFSGLRVLHLSDLHFTGLLTHDFYTRLIDVVSETPADLIVFTGDLLDKPELIDWLPSTLGRLSAPLGCYYILGNHDWHLQPDEIRTAFDNLGWIDCQDQLRPITRDDQTIWLAGDERPWMGQGPDFSQLPNDACRILLSHTPDNIAWARRNDVDLMLSGHNHGGQIKLPLIGPVYSPSLYGVQFTDGEFYLTPTTLHVSRGIAGRHPLRIRCRPEATLLELHTP